MSDFTPTCCGQYALPVHATADYFCTACRRVIKLQPDAPPVVVKPANASKREHVAEATMQRSMESWLRLRGIYPRESGYILNPPADLVGWYIHMVKCRGNPIIADLLILVGGRAIEIELKAPHGTATPEQAALVESGHVSMHRTLEGAIDRVAGWMEGAAHEA